jgi:plastocyanin
LSAPFIRALVTLALLLPALPSTADVTGTVTIQGPPNSKDESFYARANGCGESPIRHTENWKIGLKGELQEVVVWIVDPKLSNVPQGRPVSGAPSIRQVQCRYEPHVIAETAGVPFKIINTDPTLHNIRAKVYDGPGQPPGADVFNFGQSYQGQSDDQQFDSPGIYTLQCDVHSWMQAWIRVFPHRDDGYKFFAVTDKAGGFSVPDGALLADGDYKMDAWHPRFAQTLEQIVHVKGGTGSVSFQFDGTKSFQWTASSVISSLSRDQFSRFRPTADRTDLSTSSR